MQATSETVYIYVARQSYRGSGNNDPSMEMDDIIHVSAEFLHRQNINKDKPDGWLYGVNMRTGQEGYFPGYFLLPNGTQIRTMTPRRRPPPLPDGKAPINDKQEHPPVSTCLIAAYILQILLTIIKGGDKADYSPFTNTEEISLDIMIAGEFFQFLGRFWNLLPNLTSELVPRLGTGKFGDFPYNPQIIHRPE